MYKIPTPRYLSYIGIEVWRAIDQYKGLYEVSNLGRVRSLNRLVKGRNNSSVPKKGKIISIHLIKRKDGKISYPIVNLWKNNKLKQHKVHCLVLRCFSHKEDAKLECRHLNGDPNDNKLYNLKWGTSFENNKDKERHGTDNKGERHGLHKLLARDISIIKQMHRSGVSNIQIGKNFNVSRMTIGDIILGKTWRHII